MPTPTPLADQSPHDLLAGANWRLICSPPGEHDGPGSVPWHEADDAVVPGSVAMSLRSALGAGELPGVEIDGLDWWYSTTVDIGAGSADPRDGELLVAGISTLWTLWWDDQPVTHGENMFRSAKASVELP